MSTRNAIFFDIDGVLNAEPGEKGVTSPDRLVMLPGASEAVARVNKAGLVAVGVTNRSQVARGYITLAILESIFARLQGELGEAGGKLDRIYYCPHYPKMVDTTAVPALSIECECRKPGTLLHRRAIETFDIDVARSSAIGDSLRDIEAAQTIGAWAYGVRTGHGCRDTGRYPDGKQPVPDHMFSDVSEAVDFCLTWRDRAQAMRDAFASRAVSGRPLIVALAGRSRSGKSTLAHALVRSLTEDGTRALMVKLDDWIVPAGQRTPGMDARARNRVEALPGIIASLRGDQPVEAPGYDAMTRGAAPPKVYDPTRYPVIVVEGLFALDASVRPLIDLAVYVEPAPEAEFARRFRDLYLWKGFGEADVPGLLAERSTDEWPLIDAQRASADLCIMPATAR